MLRFKLEPHFSSSWTQRLVDKFRFRQGTYHIPVLGADERKTFLLDTPVPEDAGFPVPLKPQKLGCQQNLESRLLQLPPELLIYAMLFLPHSSLYMVRQTCQVLRNLTDDFQFQDFHWEILQHEEQACHITIPVCDQLRNIKRIFLRRSLCKPCGKLLDSGELEERLRKLWQPVHCTGCQAKHPELLFPQGGRAHNTCVGLLGQFALCKHVKVSGKVEAHDGEEVDLRCSDPEHFPVDSMDSEELSDFKRYRPCVNTESTYGGLQYSRSFPLVKIDPQQYPEMPALKSQLLKRLKETHRDGLCQHASIQLDSIVSSLPSDKCDCFPASGLPVHQSKPTTEPRYWCNNHGYYCRHCGARYFWLYHNDYIVLRVSIHLANTGADSMGWLSNITFNTDEHPIHPTLNESTKGVLWCTDPSCGTGCGNRWLLMVEILKRVSLRRFEGYHEVPPRDHSFAANLPYTLEYQVFQNAAGWMTRPVMLSLDLLFPITTKVV